MSSNGSTENQVKNDESGRCPPIAQPVYSNENLIGFMISPSKVKDFLNQVANYQPSGELNQNTHQGGCDKPMNELVTAISQYCWKNEKCLSPTNKCGFVIFEDISVNYCTRKTKNNKNNVNEESQNVQNRESRVKTRFPSRQFPKNSTFESLSELIRYHRIHRIPSDLNDGDEQTFRLSKRAKTNSERYNNNNNRSHNFIFNPKVLTFLGNAESNSPFRFQKLLNKKTPFPPSIREDFIKLQMRTGNFPWSTGGHAVGNLPFTGDGLLHHWTASTRNPNTNSIEGPLNYDEYLTRYAEEKNKMQDFLLWDRLSKAENESRYKQSSLACSGSSSSQNILNEFSHLQQFQTEMDDSLTSINAKNENYYELAETTENIKGNLIHQSLYRFQSPSSSGDRSQSQHQCHNKKLNNFQHSENVKNKVDEKSQSGKRVAEDKIRFTYDSSTEEDDEDTNREISTNKTHANFNIPDKNSEISHSSILPMKRKFSCGVTLTKKFYYCTPPINALDLLVCAHSGSCLVNEFRVGHENFGHVTFHGEIDVMGLNLDEIVDFKLKQLTLYPNDSEEKSILPGTGLKNIATVTLFKVWPMDKSKRFFISDPVQLKRMNYENTLRKSCQRTNSTFISYKPEFGHWTFKILRWTSKNNK